MSTDTCCIAVAQMTSTEDKIKNLDIVRNLAKEAAIKHGAQMLFLPEASDYITHSSDMVNMAESLHGQTVAMYKDIAKDNNIWLSVGIHEKAPEEMNKEKVYNTQIIINNKGDMVGSYRKLHLFDAQLEDSDSKLNESRNITPGSDIEAPIKTPVGSLGLMICYDLRFPDMSTLLRKMGADVLTYPSAFTHTTGEAHWKPLLRARAIETQCYVVAAAQVGLHCAGRPPSHGCALIIDPWGRILAECPPYKPGSSMAPTIATAHIDLGYVAVPRDSMPVFAHQRPEVYARARTRLPSGHGDNADMMFADKTIPASTIFYRTPLSFAFTNLRCVVAGHVLICSRRVVSKVTQLQDNELADLFCTAVRVQRIMERLHQVGSSTLVVQDGPEAGRTVPHVHVHVLPRRQGDFEHNDDVYAALAQHDKEDGENSAAFPPRDISDMVAEAQVIRAAMTECDL